MVYDTGLVAVNDAGSWLYIVMVDGYLLIVDRYRWWL